MNIYQVISESPFLTVFALYIIARLIFRCWNRFMRMLNIRKNGWPPPHCDADGELFVEEEEEEEEESK